MSDFAQTETDLVAVTTMIYVNRFLQSTDMVDEPDRQMISDTLRHNSESFEHWDMWVRRHSVSIPLGTVSLVLGLFDTGAILWPAAPFVLSLLGALTLVGAAGHLWLAARQGHNIQIGFYREIANGAFPDLVVDSPLSDSPGGSSGAREI